MRSSNRHERRHHTSSSRRRHHSSCPPPPPVESRSFCAPRMPSVFNIVRASIYLAVMVWTIICLAIAVHFQGLLVASDLTRFVPFAIFVCSASLLIMLVLLLSTYRGQLNPISTRIELACLGLAGTFWIALGAFLASSASEEADVECFESGPQSTAIEVPGFSTETYHAQYRVLEAFSLFNAALIWGFFIFLLILALRKHYYGSTDVWFIPVSTFPWFYAPSSKLPQPVISRNRGRSQSRGARYEDKPRTSPRYDAPKARDFAATRPPMRAHMGGGRQDKFYRNASPRR